MQESALRLWDMAIDQRSDTARDSDLDDDNDYYTESDSHSAMVWDALIRQDQASLRQAAQKAARIDPNYRGWSGAETLAHKAAWHVDRCPLFEALVRAGSVDFANEQKNQGNGLSFLEIVAYVANSRSPVTALPVIRLLLVWGASRVTRSGGIFWEKCFGNPLLKQQIQHCETVHDTVRARVKRVFDQFLPLPSHLADIVIICAGPGLDL
jgi:hypothetical protein